MFNDEIQFIETADIIDTHDYWHRRVALISVSGISKILLTFATLIWISATFFPFYRDPSLRPCLKDSLYYSFVHAWVQISFAIFIAGLLLSWLLAKGIPGLCLGFCPKTLVRCKKRCARKKIRSLMEEEEEEAANFYK